MRTIAFILALLLVPICSSDALAWGRFGGRAGGYGHMMGRGLGGYGGYHGYRGGYGGYYGGGGYGGWGYGLGALGLGLGLGSLYVYPYTVYPDYGDPCIQYDEYGNILPVC